MTIFVGSTNPVKINAVTMAASETWPEVRVIGLEVPSGIPEQPMGDEQTHLGAQNRAQGALSKGLQEHKVEGEVLGVGLEGGVFDKGNELWSTVWAVVTSPNDGTFASNGARFLVPEPFATLIKKGGEMGPVVSQLTGIDSVKQKEGLIGVITNNFVDRTEEYQGIVKLALGLYYGKDWSKKLESKKTGKLESKVEND